MTPLVRRRRALASLTIALAGLAASFGAFRAQAQTDGASFLALGAAEGVRFSYSAPGASLIDTPADAGSPVSQAAVDGLGTSNAFASAPYPGDVVISGPGLAAAFTGVSAPPFPLYAASSHPVAPEAEVDQGAVALTAKSEQFQSESSAQQGGSGPDSGFGLARTTSSAVRDQDDDRVVAEASSTIDSVNVGGVLRFGRVFTRAKAAQAAGGEPAFESELVVESASIAGQTVGFTEQGFTFAGTTTPLPDASPLLQVLEESGIEVDYLAAQRSETGVVSPAVAVRQEVAAPEAPRQVVTTVLGRASATATLTGAAGGLGGSGVTGGDGDVAPAVGPSGAPAGGPVTALVGDVSTDRSTPPAAVATDTATGGAAGPSGRGGAVPVDAAGVSSADFSSGSFYLMLVFGALAALSGGQLIRLLGVRLAWTS